MPARRRTFDAVVRSAEAALRRHRVDHVFVGAISVAAFGAIRTTTDADVIADLQAEQLSPLAAEFRRRGFVVSEEDLRDSLADGSHCTIEDLSSPYRIDLAPVKDSAGKHAIREHRKVRWRGISLPIAAPEHTVVMKLRYGSEQDIRDALGILVRQRGQLDVRRMREFALQQRVVEALRDLERQAESLGGSRRQRRRGGS